MGRALIIICAGLMLAFGITVISVSAQKESMTKSNVNTYYKAKATNMAHSGIQMAIHKFEESNHNWNGKEETTYAAGNITYSVHNADTSDARVQFTSVAVINGVETKVIFTFDISKNQSLVPEFQSAVFFANSNFTLDLQGNKSLISGIDHKGECQGEKPGIIVSDEAYTDNVDGKGEVKGNPPIAVDNSTDYTKVSALIERLSEAPGVNFLPRGNYSGSLGTVDNPGIFFVEDYTKITGNTTGYGILVIRADAELEIEEPAEGELSVGGNFEFNGLVIFENQFNFDAKGTPDINGTVIFRTTPNGPPKPHIEIRGNPTIQYDCDAKKYADIAVNEALNTTVYKPLSVYEL